MRKRKCLLFFTVAFAMVVLFATTVAIAQNSAPYEVDCGPQFTITLNSVVPILSGYSANYTISSKPPKAISKVNRVVIGQTLADCLANPLDDGCDFAQGDSATGIGVGIHEYATFDVTPVSGANVKTFSVTAKGQTLGAFDIFIDTGAGIEACATQIAGFGDGDTILGAQQCVTDWITFPPIKVIDEGVISYVNPPPCPVETCFFPNFTREVLRVDGENYDRCDISTPNPLPLPELVPGLTAMENGNKFGRKLSPDQSCTAFGGYGSCAAACCPTFLGIPSGSCVDEEGNTIPDC